MHDGNRFGVLGLAALVLVQILQSEHHIWCLVIAALLQWTAICLVIAAGIRRPRAWLLLLVPIVGRLVYLLSLGHSWT